MPEIKMPTKGLVKRKVMMEIDSPIETVFNYLSAEESLTKFLKRYGPVHAVVKHETHKGPWSMPGACRTLYFENGDTLREELISFQPNACFSYRISDFTSAVNKIADAAYGEFSFASHESKTRVTWAYFFHPKNILSSVAVSLFMSLFFKKYMQHSLAIAKKDIENIPFRKANT